MRSIIDLFLINYFVCVINTLIIRFYAHSLWTQTKVTPTFSSLYVCIGLVEVENECQENNKSPHTPVKYIYLECSSPNRFQFHKCIFFEFWWISLIFRKNNPVAVLVSCCQWVSKYYFLAIKIVRHDEGRVISPEVASHHQRDAYQRPVSWSCAHSGPIRG